MQELVEILSPSETIYSDKFWHKTLCLYGMHHTGLQVKEAIDKLNAKHPIRFNTFTVTSVTTLVKVIECFSPKLRHAYLESIQTLPLPSFTAREWVYFLQCCSEEQCHRFLNQLSHASCSNLCERFFTLLMAHTRFFSINVLETILTHIKRIQTDIPSIIPANYKLHGLRYGGDDDDAVLTAKISLTLRYLQHDLPHLTLTIEELVDCLSLKVGALQNDRERWVSIKKAYLMGLANQLPYLFHSEAQVSLFYKTFSEDCTRNDYRQPLTHQQMLTYTPDVAKAEFEETEQTCFDELPNTYQFLTTYKHHPAQTAAEDFIGLLVQDALTTHAAIEELGQSTPLERALNQLIHVTAKPAPQTCFTSISGCFSQPPEHQLAHALSNLSPYWLTLLNNHTPSLAWNQHLTAQQTQACFQTYINSVKPCQEQSSTLQLRMLQALALSTVAAIMGIVILGTLSVPAGAMITACSLTAGGFFAYQANLASHALSNQPTPVLQTQSQALE